MLVELINKIKRFYLFNNNNLIFIVKRYKSLDYLIFYNIILYL